MSEYWKSNPRKFCDFCKCWIAENKPSIEFHERGKRHKENVQKRLEEIGKKGKEDYENKLKEDDYMKAMERAALKAYKKDIDLNPDLTGAKISKIAEQSNAKIVISNKSRDPQKPSPQKPETKWHEAKSPEGLSYYWHLETGESVWDAPKEGFVSLEKEKKQKSNRGSKKKKSADSKAKSIDTPKSPSEVATPAITYGPMPKGNPYGNWESTLQPVKEIDLQLPELPEQEYYAPELVIKKPEIKFKEKVVTLGKGASQGPVSFKKRKGGDEQKKNVRRRVED